MTENSKSLASVLSMLLKTLGLTEASLAKKVNIPRTTINHLVTGITADPRASTINAISEYFGISVEQLMGKKPILMDSSKIYQQTNTEYIPILDWEHANGWENFIQRIDHSNYTDWILVDKLTCTGTFGLRLNTDSMWPQFQEDEILIVDTNKKPDNRDYVIAYVASSKETLFRQIILEGGLNILKAVNPDFPIIKIGSKDKLLGVVIQAIKRC